MALPTAQITVIRRRRFLAPFLPINLLLTTLAVAPVVEGQPVAAQETLIRSRGAMPPWAPPNLLTSTLAPSAAAPFRQAVWPIPQRGERPTLTWTQARPILSVEPFPARPLNWPNPLIGGAHRVGFVHARPLYYVEPLPTARQLAWPNPLIGGVPNVGSVQNRPSYYVEPVGTPFVPLAWPNPVLRPAAALRTGHSRSLITSEIVPPEPETIHRGLVLGVPRRAAVPHVGIVYSRPSFYAEPVAAPIRPIDWPNPRYKARLPQGFIGYYVFADIVPPPFVPGDWPNPQYQAPQNVGSVRGRPSHYVEPGIPLRPFDWPNPRYTAPQNRGSVHSRPSYYVEPPPPQFPAARLLDWPNPLIGGANLVGFVQNKPVYYVDAELPVARLLDWPNPLIGGANAVGFVQSRPVYYFSEPAFAFHIDERPIRRLRRAPHLTDEDTWVFYTYLQLDLEAGLGADGAPCNVQGTDPQVMLRWSDDDGETWSNEYWVSAGAIGEYARRAIWRRLGRARDRIFEVTVSDPVPWHLIAAYLDIKPGKK